MAKKMGGQEWKTFNIRGVIKFKGKLMAEDTIAEVYLHALIKTNASQQSWPALQILLKELSS